MRKELPINDRWRFAREERPGWTSAGFDDSSWEEVDIPHTNMTLERHYFDDSSCGFVSCYRRWVSVPADWNGMRLFLRFEAIASCAQVFVDGTPVFGHEGGYTPFEGEITRFAEPGRRVCLAVVVDSTERAEVPPFGGAMDYLAFGGIYRNVSLAAMPKVALSHLRVRTLSPLDELPEIDVDVFPMDLDDLRRSGGESSFEAGSLCLELEIVDASGNVLDSATSSLSADNDYSRLVCRPEGVLLWSPSRPVLYRAVVALKAGDEELDRLSVRFGVREVTFTASGFFLNGEMMKLQGLDRHQCYPYIGYAAPDSLQQADAQLLKDVLCVDMVRTSHYPQSPAFLDRCDELGLLVLPEIPGWQHVGDGEHWRDLCLDNVRAMIERDWNHPSIVAWGVRINESPDDHDLYSRTNALAHMLDPTRPTCGVRNFAGSELLEDIYTYNDFIHRGDNAALDDPKRVTKSKTAPYLVTEFNGHMYPTKRYDDERHRTEHALRHARVLDAMYGNPRICGAIGWCMADYSTHAAFGSGDQVCYHGVCDQFRIPKLAAWVYASQRSSKPVMAVSSTMSIGDHPGGDLGTVAVFTNCDRVDLYLDGAPVGRYYPARDRFPNLPHPPVMIDDLIGERIEAETRFSAKDRGRLKRILLKASQVGFDLPVGYKVRMLHLMAKYRMGMAEGVALFSKYVGGWGSGRRIWRFEGVVNDTVVRICEFGASSVPLLRAEATKSELHAGDTYDMALIKVTAVLAGNVLPLPYANEPLCVTASGSVALASPSPTLLEGGACGIFVRTHGVFGPGRVDIHGSMGDISVGFMVS
ncbi:MAG: glycoside hydrolase family 2 TIM barrel-domain containing protein [Sphaerochaetaceae bacterium]